MKNKPVLQSLGHAILVFIYVSCVVGVMLNGERVFGAEDTIWIPVVMLMLLVLSVAVMGALVLGRPILLYLSGAKKEAIQFFGYTLGWLSAILLSILLLHLLL
jgi:hypothetical protein